MTAHDVARELRGLLAAETLGAERSQRTSENTEVLAALGLDGAS